MTDEQRLQAFDAFAREVREELCGIVERMAQLGDEGKTKTATYRQLFAARVTLKEIDRRLSERGL